MLAATESATAAPRRALLQLRWRPTNEAAPPCPTGMINLANAFILILGVAAAWLGTAALVQKRTVRRRKEQHRSSNVAA